MLPSPGCWQLRGTGSMDWREFLHTEWTGSPYGSSFTGVEPMKHTLPEAFKVHKNLPSEITFIAKRSLIYQLFFNLHVCS